LFVFHVCLFVTCRPTIAGNIYKSIRQPTKKGLCSTVLLLGCRYTFMLTDKQVVVS